MGRLEKVSAEIRDLRAFGLGKKKSGCGEKLVANYP